MHAVLTTGLVNTLLERSKLVAFKTEGSALTMMPNALNPKPTEPSMLTAAKAEAPARLVRSAGVGGQELGFASGDAMQTVPTAELVCPLEGRTTEGAISNSPRENTRNALSNSLSRIFPDYQDPTFWAMGISFYPLVEAFLRGNSRIPSTPHLAGQTTNNNARK
jgi:hypothetical protein